VFVIEPRAMRIGYLVTEYPAVSHTFIRREIHALEALGVEVVRYTVRRQRSGPLKDPLDLAEAEKTKVILEVGAAGLALASSRIAAREPLRFAKAARSASAMGRRSERGLAYHGAYLAEACVLREWLEGPIGSSTSTRTSVPTRRWSRCSRAISAGRASRSRVTAPTSSTSPS
jgi:hypothetical protein